MLVTVYTRMVHYGMIINDTIGGGSIAQQVNYTCGNAVTILDMAATAAAAACSKYCSF